MSTTDHSSVTDAESAITRGILAEQPFQANVFSAWSDGFAAGLSDLDAYTHRSYERGKRDAEAAPPLGWMLAMACAFVAGFVIAIAAFA